MSRTSEEEMTCPLLHPNENETTSPLVDEKIGTYQSTQSIKSRSRVTELKEAKVELEACISILIWQIRKEFIAKYLPRISFHSILTTILGYCLYHFINSVLEFNKHVSQFDTKTWNKDATCDDIYANCASSNWNGEASPFFFDECSNIVSSLQNCPFSTWACTETYKNIVCSGPGMWYGYTPVIWCFGIVMPFLLSMTSIYTLFKYHHFLSNLSKFLDYKPTLNDEKNNRLDQCAHLNGIRRFGSAYGNHHLTLNPFKEKLALVQTELDETYESKLSFLCAAGDPHSMPHKPFFKSDLFERKLIKGIFEFAGFESRTKENKKTLSFTSDQEFVSNSPSSTSSV